MKDKEIIIRQAEKIIELEDKLAESKESANYFYNKCEKYEAEKKLKENGMDVTELWKP